MKKKLIIAVPCDNVRKIKHDIVDRDITITEWVNEAINQEIKRRKL